MEIRFQIISFCVGVWGGVCDKVQLNTINSTKHSYFVCYD